jgi:hypothetical protein
MGTIAEFISLVESKNMKRLSKAYEQVAAQTKDSVVGLCLWGGGWFTS